MLWNKSELIEALEGELLSHDLPDNLTIDEVVIDSRKAVKNGLFIAIKGDKNDGHEFLEQAEGNGCKVAIVSEKNLRFTTNDAGRRPSNLQLVQKKINFTSIYDLRFVVVRDTFVALYKLAEFSRKRSRAKIIAITGSVGKTGTKEMLKLAFDSQGKVFATPGNLNNHFGLPLCLCNFSRDYDFGIFEMGMNHLGEIEPLSKLAKPHLAVITNVGPVHIEFFKNEEEIALAKSEIFSGLVDGGTSLINADNQHFEFLKKRAKNFLSFGQKNFASYQILAEKIIGANLAQVEAKLRNDEKISYQIASSNPAIIFNSIIAIACLDLLGSDLKKGLLTLKNLTTPAGRGKISEIKLGEKNITIIDDSYNASVVSMRAGLDHAADLKKILGKKRVIAALGDMLELGKKSVELHEEIANYLQKFHIDFAILVGEKMTEISKKLPKNSYKTFSDSSSASLEIQGILQDGDILYLKGSRGMRMEKLIENLTNQKSAH